MPVPAADPMRLVREVGALWLLENERAGELLAEASLACAAADARPELVTLAGLHPTTSWWELKEALDAALRASGFDALDVDSRLVPVLALRAMCRRFLHDRVGALALLESAHDLVGHSGDPSAAQLIELCDLGYEPGCEALRERATILPDVTAFLRATAAL